MGHLVSEPHRKRTDRRGVEGLLEPSKTMRGLHAPCDSRGHGTWSGGIAVEIAQTAEEKTHDREDKIAFPVKARVATEHKRTTRRLITPAIHPRTSPPTANDCRKVTYSSPRQMLVVCCSLGTYLAKVQTGPKIVGALKRVEIGKLETKQEHSGGRVGP